MVGTANTRHWYVESRGNLGPSETWEICFEEYGMTSAGGLHMPSVTPRTWREETHAHYQLCPKYRFPILTLLQYKGKGKVIQSEGQGLLPFGKERQGLSNKSQPLRINSLNWLASGGS